MTTRKVVTEPYQDPRSRYTRSGEREWTVTVTTGALVNHHRRDTEDAAREVYDGYRQSGYADAHADDPHEVDHSWTNDGNDRCRHCGAISADREAQEAAQR